MSSIYMSKSNVPNIRATTFVGRWKCSQQGKCEDFYFLQPLTIKLRGQAVVFEVQLSDIDMPLCTATCIDYSCTQCMLVRHTSCKHLCPLYYHGSYFIQKCTDKYWVGIIQQLGRTQLTDVQKLSNANAINVGCGWYHNVAVQRPDIYSPRYSQSLRAVY